MFRNYPTGFRKGRYLRVFEMNAGDTYPDKGISVRFVTRKWAPAMGGMETYCHRLTEELAKTRSLDIIALPGKPDGSAPSSAALLGFGVSAGFKLLKRPSARVFHFGDMAIWPLAWISRLRHKHAKYVISAHGTDASFPLRGGILGSVYGAYLRLGARLLPHMTVIANSRATADACRISGYRNVQIVSLATDMQPHAPLVKQPRKILFAGRLVKQKGLAWFVQNVLPQLPQNITMNVAGTVWDKEEGAALANPRVHFLGRLDEGTLAQAYADALCVVVPNIDVAAQAFEGFGLVATEAAGAGAIVLASYHSGLKEALLDGETGFHVTPGDAQAWVTKIMEILAWDDHERTTFKARVVDAVNARYRWDRVARETTAFYQTVT
jgi:glycosyltransferase involved in cell wall biosynthesis